MLFWGMLFLAEAPRPPAVWKYLLLLLWVEASLLPLLVLAGPLPSVKSAWRLLCRVRRFRTARGTRVVLRYAPELTPPMDPGAMLIQVETRLQELEARLGPLPRLPFRKRLFVYLFKEARDVEAIFGEGYGGTALGDLHAVILGDPQVRLYELLKHELTHLFTHRWNPWALPLFSEGLSTWAQGTAGGYTIDSGAVFYLRLKHRALRPLLDRTTFYQMSDRWGNYLLAGSFTGFLLRRFGLKAYRKFYRELTGVRGFDRKFKKHFQWSLEEAEAEWRKDLEVRHGSPMYEWWPRRPR
jgi:hypothetical protein